MTQTGFAETACIQQQNGLQLTAWQTEKHTFNVLDKLKDKATYGILNQCGLLLAWHDLKSTAKSAQDYYNALRAILAQADVESITITQTSHETSTLEATGSLRRYLLDPEVYQSTTQPLDEAWFNTVFQLLHAELSQYGNSLPQEEQLTFEQVGKNTEYHAEARTLETEIYILLIHGVPLTYSLEEFPLISLRQLIAKIRNVILPKKPVYEEAYELLVDRITAQFPNLCPREALHFLLNRIHHVYTTRLRTNINQGLSTYSDEAALTSFLLPLLETAADASSALEVLKEGGKSQEVLLDALRLENEACSILQAVEDFSILCKPLSAQSIKYLYQKRTPATWGKLIHSIEDLTRFCWSLQMAEKNILFRVNAAKFAALIQSDMALKAILPVINEYQLKAILPYIPEIEKRHWIQTPNTFKALLSAEQNAREQKKLRHILNAIPSPYRITVLLPLAAEARANLLKVLPFTWVTIYFQMLSPEEWKQLFESPAALRKFILQFDKTARIQLLISMPGSFKEVLYQQLKAQTQTTETPSQLADVTDFKSLKAACLSLFPETQKQTTSSSIPFYTYYMHNISLIIEHQPDLIYLKHAMVDIFCTTKGAAAKTAALEACALTEAYQTKDHLNDADAHPTKRLRT